MDSEILVLMAAAASVGCLHALMGPDHYLPFIMMAAAKKWSLPKTAWITALCGFGHVLGSVILGAVGVAIGLAVGQLEWIEGFRGQLAAWLLIGFGLAYFLWGLKRAWKDRPHSHWHTHADGTVHNHIHSHHREHAHIHEDGAKSGLTPWALFIIFVLGPCEALIPLMMVPAAGKNFAGLAMVTAVFAVATIGTMVAAVLIATFGISFLPLSKMQRYTHALAGAAICLCGLAIQFLKL